MPTDKHDKTVFKQQPINPDRTIIRPAPGGRSANRQKTAVPQPGASQRTTTDPSIATTQFRADVETPMPADTLSLDEIRHHGLNPIVNAATTLIAVFETTGHSMSHSNVGGLHQQLVSSIRKLDQDLREQGVRQEIVLSTCYVICVALDEAVLKTPWGSESAWTQRTLLSLFYNETSGGEKFFQLLDRMLEYPAENIDILELIYILLSLGFEGKYRVVDRGRDALESVRDNLFQTIRRQRGEYERSLSPGWQGLGNVRKSLDSHFPLWVIASVVGVVLILGYSGMRFWLTESSAPVLDSLQRIAQQETNPDRK